MGKHLTDEQVLAIQKSFQRNRHRGSIKDLMRQYNVSRNTIGAALRKTVAEKSSVSGLNVQVKRLRLDEDCLVCQEGKLTLYCLACRRSFKVPVAEAKRSEDWFCQRCRALATS